MAPSRNELTRSSEPDFIPPEPPKPHPSFIQVAKPYVFEHTIQQCLAAVGVNSSREDNARIQGVTWIDNVRKALRLPVRTFNTACVYYHKFRLTHNDNEYNYVDAAAAALFTACKIEDTLKKSRDILCASYNLKLSAAEYVSSDDPIFDNLARGVIGLERLMLEASGFDFRNRHPQKLLVKLAKHYAVPKESDLAIVAYCMSLDLNRTFSLLKQTTATMALACLELAARLLDDRLEEVESGNNYATWKTSREEVMETMLDLLDLYTHHRANTAVGTRFPIEAFLAVRIPLNQEADTKSLPRYTNWREKGTLHDTGAANGLKNGRESSTKDKERDRDIFPPNALTPVSAIGEKPKQSERGRDGTVRFMLDPERAETERATVAEYFKIEVEEFEMDD